MLLYKSLALLAVTAIGLTSAAHNPGCLSEAHQHILFQEGRIWSNNVGVLPGVGAGPNALVGVNPVQPFADQPAWNNFRANAEHSFTDATCVKLIFNNKANWENAYPASLNNIVWKLRLSQSLKHLNFDNLTDYAGRVLLHYAGEVDNAAYRDLYAAQFSKFRAGFWHHWGNQDRAVRYWSADLIHKIPATAFNDPLASDFVFRDMAVVGQSVFSKMTPNQVAEFIKEPARCVGLTRDILRSNLTPARVKVYTNACLLAVPAGMFGAPAGPDDVKRDIQTFLKNLNTKAFSTIKPGLFHADIAALLPAGLAAQLDSNDKTEFRCSVANLADLSAPALASVDKACMAGWVSNSGPNALVLEKKIAKLPGGIFSDIPSGDWNAFSRLITDQNMPSFTSEHWKTLLANPANCEHIKKLDKFDWSRLPPIGFACIANMKPEVREAIFSSDAGIKKLDEQVLAHFNKDLVTAEELQSIGKKRPALLKHLGKFVAVGEFHPCNHFRLDDYKGKGNKAIRQVLDSSNPSCILSIGDLDTLEEENASEDLFKDLPHTIFAALSIENLKAHKHLPKDFWSGMKPLVFEILATPANCAELDAGLLTQINADALSGLHYDCLAAMKADLTGPQVAKVTKGVFEQVDSTTLPRLKNLGSASAEQLTALSAKVADPKKHAGAAFTDATISSLSPVQIGVLNVGTVNALPDSAWKGFDPERFKALRPETLVKATCSKFKQVPTESLYELTAAQAVRTGEAVSKPEDSPRCAFTKEVIAHMKDPQAAKIMSGAAQLVVSMALVAVSMVLGLWLA